jgi:hypothetical protein
MLQYYYDTAGNMIRKITPNLRTLERSIRYEYTYNRLTCINYPFTDDVTYTYGEPARTATVGR